LTVEQLTPRQAAHSNGEYNETPNPRLSVSHD
jgi:hypothetical protein